MRKVGLICAILLMTGCGQESLTAPGFDDLTPGQGQGTEAKEDRNRWFTMTEPEVWWHVQACIRVPNRWARDGTLRLRFRIQGRGHWQNLPISLAPECGRYGQLGVGFSGSPEPNPTRVWLRFRSTTGRSLPPGAVTYRLSSVSQGKKIIHDSLWWTPLRYATTLFIQRQGCDGLFPTVECLSFLRPRGERRR